MEARLNPADEVRQLRGEVVRLETAFKELLDILGRGLYPAEVEAKVRELRRSLGSENSRTPM